MGFSCREDPMSNAFTPGLLARLPETPRNVAVLPGAADARFWRLLQSIHAFVGGEGDGGLCARGRCSGEARCCAATATKGTRNPAHAGLDHVSWRTCTWRNNGVSAVAGRS